ncbi:MAG: serine/threonine protein kinase [Saprospiraceae bacterium]|nr:serine/threonine protein kinase [Saprospiraceae bacterium]MCB9320245.1 serine/threonine protein kinase [Lewinellaceae bacterium]
MNALKHKLRDLLIIERLGSGAMGDVYQCIDQSTGKPVAVKWLHRSDMSKRFIEEARILASIHHPGIAQFIKFEQHEKEAYLVMEYVEGLTLEKLIQHHGKLPESFALKITLQIATALKYLHDQQIIHRDLKASNLKITKSGQVKLLDFGIAKAQFSEKLTAEGFVIGSTPYLAPEQFKQDYSHKIDLWALGILLYQMLTGHLPFSAATEFELRAKIQKGDYLPLEIFSPGLNKSTKKIIRKLLAVRPENRWSANELLQQMEGKSAGAFWNKWIEKLKTNR